VVLGLAYAPIAAQEPSAEDAAFFEREIRPLLIRHCYECHGDLKEPKGGLSLTSRAAILRGGENGAAAVAGKPGDSLLMSAVNYEGLEMPPNGKRLSPVDVARLTRWVERGLPWPADTPEALRKAQSLVEHERIATGRASLWSLRPIVDPPLPQVRNASWPRTSLDRFVLAKLENLGLTPSPAADKRTLLRRLTFDLIGLPPTPEEMAAFEADASPDATRRVVDRLLSSPHYGERWGRHWLDVARYADTKGYVLFQDANFPWSYTYRDYVVRSLNEDLPYDRFIVEQLAADLLPLGDDRRALTALGFLTLGNGFMNNQQDVIDDRIDVVTRGLLGLTVSCARCHDHKFDPIPTKDYYSLYGVLASATEPTVPPLFEPPPQTEAYAAFAKELAERERKLKEFLDLKFEQLVSGARSRVDEYLLAAQAQVGKPPVEDFMLLADSNDLNPTMILRYQVFLERSAKSHDPILAIWHALAALPQAEFSAKAGDVVRQRITSGPERPIHPLVAGAFLGKPLKELADAAKVYRELLAGADVLPAAALDPNLESLRAILRAPGAPANPARNEIGVLELLPDRDSQKIRTDLLTAIEKWRAEGAAAPPRAMVVEELPQPIQPRVFVRGNPNQLGEAVPRRFLQMLSDDEPPPFRHGSGRLELAQAIASRDNPLTARVMVNRVWQQHFGKALVSTPSDFGARSEPPMHPELLDHLAARFIEQGWSLKQLHREMVLSATYGQVSNDRPECRAVDAENELLWRMNRRRLDFETTRDALLAVSGRLDPALYGPPRQGICEPTTTRRTLYGHIDRLNLPGLFRTFDFPNPDATSPQRSVTTVPQQALFFMNSPLVQEVSRQMAARADVAKEPDAAGRIRRLYQLALARAPQREELELAQKFVADGRAMAWQELAQGLLEANEFVFVD